MREILYEDILFLIEFLKVFYAVTVWENEKGKNRKMLLAGFTASFLFVTIVAQKVMLSDVPLVFGILALVVLGVSGVAFEKIKMGLLIYIAISIFDMFVQAAVMIFFRLNTDYVLENFWINIPVSCISLLVMILLQGEVKNRIRKVCQHTISLKYTLILATGGVMLGIFISAVQFVTLSDINKRSAWMINISLVIGTMILALIVVLLILNKNKSEYLEKENKFRMELMKSQEQYYLMLLQKEEETKKFRHDLRNHIYCLTSLWEKGEYEELGKYLAEMNSGIRGLNMNISTGSDLLNAIVGNLTTRFPGVRIEWNGRLLGGTKLSSMDLCTIFANLLENAFEAAEQSADKAVRVDVKTLEGKQLICIENHFAKELRLQQGEILSGKSSAGHGYGLKNAKNCVEKLNGYLNINIREDIFVAEVLLPGL